jgi:hypothetical protein
MQRHQRHASQRGQVDVGHLDHHIGRRQRGLTIAQKRAQQGSQQKHAEGANQVLRHVRTRLEILRDEDRFEEGIEREVRAGQEGQRERPSGAQHQRHEQRQPHESVEVDEVHRTLTDSRTGPRSR